MNKDFENLNDEQKSAILSVKGNTLIMAGAGSGKTTTIIHRILYLLENNVSPRNILFLTFTNKAAREAQNRLSVLGEQVHLLTAGTFHHFCLRTMRRLPLHFGLEKYSVVDRDTQLSLMKNCRDAVMSKTETNLKPTKILEVYSYVRNSLLSAEQYFAQKVRLPKDIVENLQKIFELYEEKKKNNYYLDFDDMLFIFSEKLEQTPQLKENICSLYHYVFVDEMQDTNPIQWKILKQVCDSTNIYCVGDEAQSIYSFRGANFENLHFFTEKIKDSQVLYLKQNYRSTQQILDLTNWLLNSSTIEYNKYLHSATNKTGGRPQLHNFFNEWNEADWVSNQLYEHYKETPQWGNQMVLVRTARSAIQLEGSLAQKKIPYRFIGGRTLFDSAQVKDILSLLRCCINWNDEIAWKRFLSLYPKIGEKTAFRIFNKIKEAQNIDEIYNILSKYLPQQNTANVFSEVSQYITSPIQAVQIAIETMEPLLSLRYSTDWKIRHDTLNTFTTFAMNFTHLSTFIDTYTLEPIDGREYDKKDAVSIITVHSAKGLEAPICYILQVQANMYPHIRSLGKFNAEEEERRILYVAMTRAKEKLYLTRCQNNFYDDSHEASVPENRDFLQKVPAKLIDITHHLAFNSPNKKSLYHSH